MTMMNALAQPKLDKRNLKAKPVRARHRYQFFWDAVKREVYDCARHALLLSFNAAGEFSILMFKRASNVMGRRVARNWRSVYPAVVLISNIAAALMYLDNLQLGDYDPVKGYPKWLDDMKWHIKKGE